MNFLHSILHWPNAHFNLKKALLLLLALLSNQKWRWVTTTTWNQRIVLNNLRSYLERNQFSNGVEIRPTTTKLRCLKCASLLWKETCTQLLLSFRNVIFWFIKVSYAFCFSIPKIIFKKPFKKLNAKNVLYFYVFPFGKRWPSLWMN